MSHCLNPTKCSGENSGLSNPIPIQPAHIEATKLSSPALVYNKQRKQSSCKTARTLVIMSYNNFFLLFFYLYNSGLQRKASL